MKVSAKVETLLLVLCTSWALTGALQLELASVVSCLWIIYVWTKKEMGLLLIV